jgi:ribose/xylose/arabinose/galactoside ABC-type transport system permease subunit
VNLWVGLVIVLILASVIGFVNGVITVYGRIPSFITTLGMMGVLRGITLWLSPWPVNRLNDPGFFGFFGGRVPVLGLNMPIQIIWMVLIMIVGILILTRTSFGYQLRATGSNRTAAELAGIPVKRVKITAFVLTSMAACIAGVFGFAYVNSVAPTAGSGMELTVIAAVVIGGTALFGGEGSVFGTFLGAGLLTILRNGLIQLGGDGRLIDTYIGIIIVAAVLIHTHIGRKGR